MSEIKAADVMKLREMTDYPMMECKKALKETGGDIQKAIDFLRKQNAKIAVNKSEREAAMGRTFIHITPDQSKAVIMELRCESDPVSKAEGFLKLGADLIQHLLTTPKVPADVAELNGQTMGKGTVKERIEELIGLIRENMKVARFAVLNGGPFGSYIHFDNTVGTLLQLVGDKANADESLLKDICMHITAKQTRYATREDVPAEVIDKEREIAKSQAAATGKPANVVEMIAEGKIKTWFGENVLIEQPFVKDDKKTIAQVLAPSKLTVKTFRRFKVGELS